VIEQLDAQLAGPRAPERLLVSQATFDRINAELDFARPEDVGTMELKLYKGVRIDVSPLVPDDRVFAIPAGGIPVPNGGLGGVTGRATECVKCGGPLDDTSRTCVNPDCSLGDPFIRGEGTVTIDGEVIGRMSGEATHRVELSAEAVWTDVENTAAGPEERVDLAEVAIPAWAVIRAGANAHEIGATLWLVHEIKPTTGGDRYHRVFLELDTGRGLIQEQVDWPPAIKAPEPRAWYQALHELGIIGKLDSPLGGPR